MQMLNPYPRENNNGLQRALASYSESLKLLSLPLPQLTKYICGETLNPSENILLALKVINKFIFISRVY